MGKDSSPPAAPNFTAIAGEQSELNREAMREQTYSNRPAQITPWGAMNWSVSGTDDKPRWTQTTTLDPELQSSLSTQIGLGGERSDLASGMFGQVGDQYGQPVDYGKFRDVTEVGTPSGVRSRAEDAAYRRTTSRLDPRMAESAEALEVSLRNKGLRPGDQAYESEMRRFNEQRTDAYQQASDSAVGMGRIEAGQEFGQQQSQQRQSADLRRQEISETLQRRGVPLSEINALLAGQGVQPSAAAQPGVTAAGYTPGANLMGAAQQQYGASADAWNARQAQQQGMMSGAGSLALAGASMFSDRSVKTGVRKLDINWPGTEIPLYSYRYIWAPDVTEIGVMADEANPEAVTLHDGLAKVNYAELR